jgi:hypothetical protein
MVWRFLVVWYQKTKIAHLAIFVQIENSLVIRPNTVEYETKKNASRWFSQRDAR